LADVCSGVFGGDGFTGFSGMKHQTKFTGQRRLIAIKANSITVTGEPCKTPFKRTYMSIKAAKKAASKNKTLKPYRCECGLYHLTTVGK